MSEEKKQKAPVDTDGLEQIKSIEGAIEAILYAAGYPVKYEKIAEVLGLDFFVIQMGSNSSILDIVGDAPQYDASDCGEVVKNFF